MQSRALCSVIAGQLSFGLLPCSSGVVVLATADAVFLSAGFAPGLAGYCGLGAVFAFAHCFVGFFCRGRDLCWGDARQGLFVELSLGFFPCPPVGRILPVLFGANLAPSAARQSRVGAVPALAGLAVCFPFLPSALPIVFLSLGSLVPGLVVFPALLGVGGRFLALGIFRCLSLLGKLRI